MFELEIENDDEWDYFKEEWTQEIDDYDNKKLQTE